MQLPTNFDGSGHDRSRSVMGRCYVKEVMSRWTKRERERQRQRERERESQEGSWPTNASVAVPETQVLTNVQMRRKHD